MLAARKTAESSNSTAAPWGCATVPGVREILAWGAIFYPPVLTVPLIAADHGWSKAFTMGGFSVGLLVGGLVSRYVGGAIDRYGGHVVMPCGSLIGALGLAGLVVAQSAVAYFAMWMVLGVAMAASLYDPAFATLGRIFGTGARAPITALTLAGGFASTVGWPATQFLIDKVGWRGRYLVYAALLAIFKRFGLEPDTVVAIGMLFGPAQVLARICELTFARNLNPLWTARFSLALLVAAFALLALTPFSAAVAAAFAVMYGMANGLMTIARGTVPLSLFGAGGYGLLVGRIGGPFLVVQAVAPVVLAYVVERASDDAGLMVVAAFAVVALACFAAIRPAKEI